MMMLLPISLAMLSLVVVSTAFTSPFGVRPANFRQEAATTMLTMSSEQANPTTFREAEVLGLRLMQEQKYEEALQGTFYYSVWS